MAKSSMVYAGIDTGKRKLDVALAEGSEQVRFDNDAAGYPSLLAWLRRRRVKRIGPFRCGDVGCKSMSDCHCPRWSRKTGACNGWSTETKSSRVAA